MVQRSYRWTIVILCILLFSGCSSTLRLYTVAEEHSDYLVVKDANGIIYNYNPTTNELTADRTDKRVSAIQALQSYSTAYNLSHIDLNKYAGTYTDALCYSNYLVTQGYTISNIDLTSTTLDILLKGTDDAVRVLYLGSDVVRIFYQDNLNKNYFPPYIIEKEG